MLLRQEEIAGSRDRGPCEVGLSGAKATGPILPSGRQGPYFLGVTHYSYGEGSSHPRIEQK